MSRPGDAPWMTEEESEIETLRFRIELKDSLLSAANLAIRDLKLEIDRLVGHYAMERQQWENRVISLEDALNEKERAA